MPDDIRVDSLTRPRVVSPRPTGYTTVRQCLWDGRTKSCA